MQEWHWYILVIVIWLSGFFLIMLADRYLKLWGGQANPFSDYESLYFAAFFWPFYIFLAPILFYFGLIILGEKLRGKKSG